MCNINVTYIENESSRSCFGRISDRNKSRLLYNAFGPFLLFNYMLLHASNAYFLLSQIAQFVFAL